MKDLLTGLALFALALCSCQQNNDICPVIETEVDGPKVMYVDCRTEVRTMAAMKALAKDCAAQGMNAMLVEWEATFPFEKHATLKNQYAFTKEEVCDFVSYCNELGLDVIPLQNCIGHSEYILRHERYSQLRESQVDPSQVCPLKISQAVPVFKEIFAEVAALHPSQYFHIGADETYLLGQCRDCAEYAAEYGKSKLFVEYVKAMCQIVLDMGKTPVMWADIILAHPEAVAELPKELIFIDWNYGWDINKFGKLENLLEVGVNMWGATALRSGPDNIYLTQWSKHFNNLATFVPFGREHGYNGFVQTSWSTSGTYGFHYDLAHEIINMQPVRLVYPESGFKILLAATSQAFNNTEPIDPETFVKKYASEKYGFGDEDAQTLWDYFQMPQYVVSSRTGKASDGRSIADVLDECRAMRARIVHFVPKANKDEIRHFVLMLDIRINYLEYKLCESVFESSDYTEEMRDALESTMKRVCAEGRRIDRRFAALNKGYLKRGEIRYMTSFRAEKMEAFLKNLENNQE